LSVRRSLAFPAASALVLLLAGCNPAVEAPEVQADGSTAEVGSPWTEPAEGLPSSDPTQPPPAPSASPTPSPSSTVPASPSENGTSAVPRADRQDRPVPAAGTGSSTSSSAGSPTGNGSAGAPAGTSTAPSAGSSSAPTPGTTAQAGRSAAPAGAGSFAVVEEFATDVAQGSWPANGSAPSAYPEYASYRDGTSGKYFPSKVLSVHDGVLDWHCHSSMAAAVLPFGYSGFTYGTYTVRMRTEDFPGYHIAFLLWPDTDKWTHELDGPESNTSTSKPYPAVLQGANPVAFRPAPKPSTPASWHDSGFHNYTWQWGPGFVSFYQDGTKVTTVTTNVPAQGMHPVLQVEWADSGDRKPDPSITGHVYVDRVMYDPSYTVPVPTT
jgi:hypothetical protein